MTNRNEAQLIALDWGTSVCRAYLLGENGVVLAEGREPSGIMTVAPRSAASAKSYEQAFDRTFERLCGDWLRPNNDLPVIACGMIGSNHGWAETEYRQIPADLAEREPQRAALYKATVALVRAYANIADELEPAGYGAGDISRIKRELDHYLNVREIIRKASGESLDLKAYEADMRHLIDTYIEADEPRTISPFENMSLLELITKTGIASAITAQLARLKGNRDAIAETIENNVRRKIIKEHLGDPAYYAKMSTLLDEIITARKAKSIEYEEYLRRIAEVARRVEAGLADDTPEQLRHSPARRALYNNLKVGGDMVARATRAAEALGEYSATGDPVLALALKLDSAVRRVRPDGWRGVHAKEQVIRAALYGVLQHHAEVERLFLIVKAQGEY